jgi:hypothetical protein
MFASSNFSQAGTVWEERVEKALELREGPYGIRVLDGLCIALRDGDVHIRGVRNG